MSSDHNDPARPETNNPQTDMPEAHRVEAEQRYEINLPQHLGDLVAWTNRRLMEKTIAKGHSGLKMTFADILVNMAFSRSRRLVDIAERTGMSKQALGQIASEIEQLGYIKRVPDPEDGRAKNLQFTPIAFKLIEDSLLAVDEVEQEFIDAIGAEKVATLREIVYELATKLPDCSSFQRSK